MDIHRWILSDLEFWLQNSKSLLNQSSKVPFYHIRVIKKYFRFFFFNLYFDKFNTYLIVY